MLTISELATHAGVTVRAVRHYHQVGLLPEPERDHSGYRTYGASAVVALVRIRTLARAGVPLSRVGELLDADESDFAAAIGEIDRRLRQEIRQRHEHRRQLAQLTSGDSLVLPGEVVAYLERLRELGISERMISSERDGWILLAARWPEKIPQWMPEKWALLEDPRHIRLYRLLGDVFDGDDPEDRRLEEAADLMVEINEEALARDRLDSQDDAFDDPVVDLLDALAVESDPRAVRLRGLVRQRGWSGWNRSERL